MVRNPHQIKAGNGRSLKRFRPWQMLSRALFYLSVTNGEGRPVVYAVDVPYWQRVLTDDGHGKAHLYRDGEHHAHSKLPAAFPVEGGTIEVVPTSFGLKRCHYVTEEGAASRLVPDERSAEGRRARFDREHPVLSRLIGALSLSVLFTSVALIVLQIVEALAAVPPVAERLGTFTSPIGLSIGLNSLLALCASTAAVERATRLRWNPLLDGSA
ncbi:hypothetical protein ACWGSK_21690 [Nocardiopsis sp. NPDC055551]